MIVVLRLLHATLVLVKMEALVMMTWKEKRTPAIVLLVILDRTVLKVMDGWTYRQMDEWIGWMNE